MTARTLIATGAALALCLALSACEKSQAETARVKKADAHAATGVEGAASAYQAGGWKAGDPAGWEQQLRTRAQAQNDYVRTPARTLGGAPVPGPAAMPAAPAAPAASSTGT